MPSGLYIPSRLKRARTPVSVVFYRHTKTKRIVVGFPEKFPTPKDFEKIVCRSAAEVEKWSQRLREQEKADEEMTEYQRELVEGPMREYARAELRKLAANARNQFNRDFCLFALKKLEEAEKRGKLIRESWMHQEAFEQGH